MNGPVVVGSVVLGVDAGGTKTDVLVAGAGGEVLGRARGGGANHERIGFAAAERVLADAVGSALAAAGAAPGDVAASAWALAGLDWPSDEVAYRAVVGRIGLAGPAVLVNDAVAALRAGVPAGPGVAVVSGTGVVAAGRAADGRTWRTFGMTTGPGDWGAGPDVVRAAADAVAQAEMGLGPATALTDLVAGRAGGVTAYLEGAYRRGRWLLTPADVWDVAAAGDGVAGALADRVAASLAAAAVAVARRLDVAGAGGSGALPVVLAGRVLDPGHPQLHARLVARLAEALPAARPRPLGVAPVVGAALLAREAAGWPAPAHPG